MNRREMLKKSMFGGILLGGIPVTEAIKTSNENIINADTYRQPKSTKPGALAICYGDVCGSPDFPIRPKDAIASDGQIMYFLWPSEGRDSRGYLEFQNRSEIDLHRIVFRFRMTPPEAPYYLHWHRGDYYLYTAPGSLMERASTLIRNNDQDDTLQALSDIRQAIILNLTVCGNGQKYLDRICDLDRAIRDSKKLFPFWEQYKQLLSETRP